MTNGNGNGNGNGDMARHSVQPWQVLIVDDEPVIREVFRLVLAADSRFHVVAEASDGIEAVTEAAAHQPDVIVLDLAMPRMGGREALPLLREASPSSRIVVCSAHGASEAEVRAMGADAYVEKPHAPRTLTERLAVVCDAGAAPA